MREKELIVYRNMSREEGKLLSDMSYIMDHYKEIEGKENLPEKAGKMKEMFYACIHELLELAGNHGFYGNLWHCYLANLLVNDENSYSRACEVVGAVSGSINQAVLHDIVIFKEFFDFDFAPLTELFGKESWALLENYKSGNEESKVYNTRIRGRICDLAEQFRSDHTPEEMKETLTRFYKDYGVGKFGLHKAFRIVSGEAGAQIVPITNIAHVHLDDLVGYESQKRKLTENTEAFVGNRKANNCLLFGDAGTGKSSSIKAIANEYYEKGLRIIEIYKHQFRDLNDVIGQIKNRNYKFIIYMDDLSFEDFETDYKYLKAVIEGGLEKKPKNVLIYATSNRRHLIRETTSDKNDRDEDLHTNDTVQEKLSLAYRFGVTIYFGKPAPKEFQNIVRTLAKRYDITMDEETLLAEANKWELSHGGLSGRTAQQFIDYLLGKPRTAAG
ncbi:MAG: ATP-binding protein [Lachnospiraceae bacterium]|jgi:predicted AAA+ superfamily ATPase|nr:ATP-binding protein [Lachnospiraceae bacterium]